MDNTIQPLSSNILSTGNRFIITNKTTDGTFGPGTIGIMSYVKGVDVMCENVAHLHVIILKRGKNGIPRLDMGSILVPIFNFKNIDSSTIMPDKKQKYYVYIEPKAIPFHTVKEMPDLDYVGWCLSWTCFLYKLSRRGAHPFSIWPTNSKNIINYVFNTPSFWKEDPKHVFKTLCSNVKREEFIERMRIIETTLCNHSLSYMLKVSLLEIHAIEYLMKHNKDKIKICNKKILDKTRDVFMQKYFDLNALKMKEGVLLKKELRFPIQN